MMLNQIIALLKSKGIDCSGVTEDTGLVSDLKLDSLKIIEMISMLEDEFDIEIPDKAIKELKTVGDVIHLIESLRK